MLNLKVNKSDFNLSKQYFKEHLKDLDKRKLIIITTEIN